MNNGVTPMHDATEVIERVVSWVGPSVLWVTDHERTHQYPLSIDPDAEPLPRVGDEVRLHLAPEGFVQGVDVSGRPAWRPTPEELRRLRRFAAGARRAHAVVAKEAVDEDAQLIAAFLRVRYGWEPGPVPERLAELAVRDFLELGQRRCVAGLYPFHTDDTLRYASRLASDLLTTPPLA
jgi:hypothetical protein